MAGSHGRGHWFDHALPRLDKHVTVSVGEAA